MGMVEVLRLVEEIMGEGLRGQRMWYSLKCNRFELLPLGRDGDVKKLMKGNNEYAYLYVAGRKGSYVGWVHGNEKLGLKVDKRKTELEKWKNGVGDRIEKKLRKTLANIGFVVDVKLFNTALGEYGVLLTNNCSLVRLLQGGSQSTIYINSIHAIETHDSATVDNTTGLVVVREALDDGYNRRILPPLNPRPQGRPQKRRIQSQRQGILVRKCSKCGEVRHYRNMCRNPRANFNADETTVIVPVEDLFEGNYVQEA
ncbi:hypothetical protein Cgig2_015345 [Carnegiea gigantea]|uniref:Uncharacterized protein n=1 Tax=Carnegiea gigantea TaxID=171969 RepID=A0A9Q1GKP1_9CARY|nr:hypothetical protein Cgig2_015345 [Carnegiea gigantea]